MNRDDLFEGLTMDEDQTDNYTRILCDRPAHRVVIEVYDGDRSVRLRFRPNKAREVVKYMEDAIANLEVN